jgi:hypothetical protein
MRGRKTLSCYAIQEAADSWEAICTDLDIAVQGNSFDDVNKKLNEAIHSYISYVGTLSEKEREELLTRRAPWHVRMGCLLCSVGTFLFRKPIGRRHDFTIPCEV